MPYILLLLIFIAPNAFSNDIVTVDSQKFDVRIIIAIVSIIGLFVTIKKTHLDIYKKKEIQDFKMVNEYFSKEKIKRLSDESTIIQDLAISTVSHFKGLNFNQIKTLLSMSDIHLYEINRLRKLIKIKYLNADFSYNSNYKKYIHPLAFLLFSSLVFIAWSFLISAFITYLIQLYGEFSTSITLTLFAIFIAIPEIFWLFAIEKRFSIPKDIKWYEQDKKRFQNIDIIIN